MVWVRRVVEVIWMSKIAEVSEVVWMRKVVEVRDGMGE